MNKIENCQIASTHLGSEDHGILTCFLSLKGDGWGVGFGGYALDTYNKELNKRIPTAKGFGAIKAIMDTLEVEKWEDIPGTYIRAETEGWGGKCKKIGHLMKDKWFSFDEYFAEESI